MNWEGEKGLWWPCFVRKLATGCTERGRGGHCGLGREEMTTCLILSFTTGRTRMGRLSSKDLKGEGTHCSVFNKFNIRKDRYLIV